MKIENIFKVRLFKDMSFIISGTLIAQLIPILLQPILRRLFSPEDFGAFDIYFRSVGLLAIIFSLRYEKAIVLCNRKNDAISIYFGIILTSVSFLIITELFLILFPKNVLNLIDLPLKYSIIIYLIPVSALFFAITTASQFYLIRDKRFFVSSSLKIYRRGVEGAIQTGSGALNLFIGLSVGDAIGNATSSFMGFLKINKDINWKHFSLIIKRFRINAARFSDFPKYALFSNLMNAFVLSALTFQVYSKFSIEQVGYLELTQKILTIPSALIGMAIGQIVLQRISSAYNNKKKVIKTITGLFSLSLLIAIPFFIIIYFWAPSLFNWAFGNGWEISGIYAQSILLSTCCYFIISPLGQALVAIRQIKKNSIWELGKFILIGSLFFIKFQDIGHYLKVYNILLIVVYCVYLTIIVFNLVKYEKQLKQ